MLPSKLPLRVEPEASHAEWKDPAVNDPICRRKSEWSCPALSCLGPTESGVAVAENHYGPRAA